MVLLAVSVVVCNLVFATIVTAQHIDYQVGVYYYPWYYNDFHGGNYLREHLVPAQLPELGEYNDREQAVIDAHLRWSHQAGIDFWSTSWWGPGSREDVTLINTILKNPNLGNLKIAILYETVGRTNELQDYSTLGPDIAHLADNYFSHPNYLKIEGKPAVMVYLTRVLSDLGTLNSSLSAMRQAAAAKGYELYIIGDHVFGSPPASAEDIAPLDAVTNYDVYGSMGVSGYAGQAAVTAYYADQAGWKTLAKNAGIDYVPAVTPGFNDNAVRPEHSPLSRKLSPGAGFGSLFRQMLRGAKTVTDADIGHMIMVTSWNEWHEDTQIEPVALATPTAVDDSAGGSNYTNGLAYEGYGMRYLDILRQETFPQSTPLNPAIPLLLLRNEEPPNLAFVTSQSFHGDLGGLSGADQICQDLAKAAGLPNNKYVAWLSTPEVNAADRLGKARGWVRVDGKPLADTLEDLAAGRIFQPLRVDELGNFDDTHSGMVWTGRINWAGNGESCNSWTSADGQFMGVFGTSDGMGYVSLDFGNHSCSGAARLFCFGVEKHVPVSARPIPGRIAFVTRGTWVPGGGLASADQLCQNEAAQAGLNGSFKALLASSNASAASRFSVDSTPWVRPDGVTIASTGAVLFEADYINSAMQLLMPPEML